MFWRIRKEISENPRRSLGFYLLVGLNIRQDHSRLIEGMYNFKSIVLKEVVDFDMLFIQIWKRKESEYSFLWNTYSLEDSELIRPEFHGVIRTSPITGKPEKYFPRWKRWLRYAVSFVLTLPVLCIAVGAMICSLNLNGYIKDKESPVYLSSLAYFAEPVSSILTALLGKS